MKLLFFDMEFANGQVPGSIYSFGYLVTDEEFRILTPPTDLCINPECQWNAYVEEHILAYPKETVEASPAFPALYERIKALFNECDVAVGFAVGNDVKALRRDCARYDLPALPYRYFDMEKLCRKQDAHKDAHGLGGYYTAWCGTEAENRHRSDGDAYATMRLLQALCEHHHVDAEMMIEAYPECAGDALPVQKESDADKQKQPSKKKKKRRWFHRKAKKTAQAEQKALK
ncbi:MAG: 3'-5' exonuclease [Clostridia bacterium]|nr:3'-5' exonuclease [Clostridia bacterium]